MGFWFLVWEALNLFLYLYPNFGSFIIPLCFFSEVRSFCNCCTAGSLNWQGSCIGANCQSNGKFIEAATTDTASSYPGLYVVVLATSTAAGVADNSLNVVLVTDDACSNRWFHIELLVVVCAGQAFVLHSFRWERCSAFFCPSFWSSPPFQHEFEGRVWIVYYKITHVASQNRWNLVLFYLFVGFCEHLCYLWICHRGNSCLSFGQIIHFVLLFLLHLWLLIVQGFGINILFVGILVSNSHLRSDTWCSIHIFVVVIYIHFYNILDIVVHYILVFHHYVNDTWIDLCLYESRQYMVGVELPHQPKNLFFLSNHIF